MKALLVAAAMAATFAGMSAVSAVRSDTLRCRDTLHGRECSGERGYQLRCRDNLLGHNCQDNRGTQIRCRNTLLGQDCDTRKRR